MSRPLVDSEQRSEQALLKRITDGDEQALHALYESYEPRIYRFALKRLGNSFDAADVLNDVLLQVWRSADRFQGRSKVSTWILGIAHHKVIDRLRQRGRADFEELDPQMANEDEVSVVRALSAAQELEQLVFCMDRLKDGHRQVIHLAFVESLSYPDIAAILECPEGTVKTRMFHARKQIQACLQRHFSTDRG
ncbi:MAG: sigma-70 family RNA polymerase sigma factor [Sedimenticola sp.]|nr:sigma-70 family RNA polymerase sigma factor [Sedimenticola sp.]